MIKKVLLLVILILFSLPSCKEKQDNRGVELNLGLQPEILSDLQFVQMEYEFRLGDRFQPLTKNYHVFVHLYRPNRKEILLLDDHMPPKSTSQWSKGESVKYVRSLFIPQFLNEFDPDFEGHEEIRLQIGLYNPDAQANEKEIPLLEKRLDIKSSTTNAMEVFYDKGWYDYETDTSTSDFFDRSWRWTDKKALCTIENPKKTAMLIIKGGVKKAALPDQKISFKVNGTLLEEFIPENAGFSRLYTLTPEIMGNSDEFTLQIEADKTFVPSKLDPANNDNRELGVQVKFICVMDKTK